MNLTDRQDYYDVSFDQLARVGVDVVQLKYDGWWCRMVVDAQGGFAMYSRTGNQLKSGQINPAAEGVYIGEYMFGTQWAQNPTYKEKLFLFDCWQTGDVDTTAFAYRDRYALLRSHKELLPDWCHLVANYQIPELPVVWSTFVESGQFEGVVFRNRLDNASAKVFRTKKEITDTYTITAVIPGEGKYANCMGALECLTEDKKTARVGGGFTDEQRREIFTNPSLFIGQKIEVSGKAKFESGLIRHPNFVRFKDL